MNAEPAPGAKPLIERECTHIAEGAAPLSEEGITGLIALLPPGWSTEKTKEGITTLVKLFKFKDFKDAVAFIDRVALAAEVDGHHPNLCLFSWNKVKIELYTHSLRGLHENDFIMAAKVEREA